MLSAALFVFSLSYLGADDLAGKRLGSLTPDEIRAIENFSDQKSFQEFVIRERRRFRNEKIFASLSPFVLTELGLGAYLFHRSYVPGHPLFGGKKCCPKMIAELEKNRSFRWTERVVGFGLFSLGSYSLYAIWSKKHDEEEEWVKAQDHSGEFDPMKREVRKSVLIEIEKREIQRSLAELSLPKNINVEIVFHAPRDFWTGYAEEAWLIFKDDSTGTKKQIRLYPHREVSKDGETLQFYWSVDQ